MNYIDNLAQILWDYNQMHHWLAPADCILVCGSHDLRVAERGVDLFEHGLAPYIIFSGGLGRLTTGLFAKPEAELFAEVARRRNVPEDKIIIENQSANSGENISFTHKLLEENGLNFNSFILVQKPYMERRAYAVFRKQMPHKEVKVTSPKLSFEEYCSGGLSKDQVINILVGDTQRIKIYAEKGFQIAQEIPAEVWKAFEELVKLGYTEHLVNSSSRN
jgi:uncharacterized SAM-binding protein YcdF (DUF218 family)